MLATGTFTLPVAVDAVEIRLEPLTGVELRGHVTKAGRGVPNAHVRVTSGDGRSISGSTAGDGSFVLERVPEGLRELRIRSLAATDHRRSIEVREGLEIVVELPAAEISGYVRDAESGAPMTGIKVDLEPLADPDSPTEGELERAWHSTPFGLEPAAGEGARSSGDGGVH